MGGRGIYGIITTIMADEDDTWTSKSALQNLSKSGNDPLK